ncbi:MAG: cytochrome c maturation protein CcmE [Thermodesulfovibrionia bacterium]|nr:MAG: cytochrome c maturation protein CcmE [Thermodesulfovibrionia bacterium]
MKNKTKVIVISIVFLSSFVYLFFLGMKEGTMFYLEVSEFVQQVDKIGDRKVRINGAVIKGTLNFDPETHKLVFTLKDTKGPEILHVVYKGAPPDLMEEEGITLVAEGSYDKRQNVFVSKKLLVKCPSKYEKKEGKEDKV